MGAISSIHFEQSKINNTVHNDRTIKPSYLLKKGGQGVEVNRNYKDALELKNKIIKDAQDAYKKRTKQKIQATRFEWSAVVNIKEDTTMSDLEKLANHLENKYGFQCYQIAIHRDEGHIEKETQEIKINQHAHLEFITLNKDGINKYRKCIMTNKVMRELQTEVAHILGMERGQENSKSKHLNHYQYKDQMRKQEKIKEKFKEEIKELKKELATEKEKTKSIDTQTNKKKLLKKDVKKFLEDIRKSWKGKGYSKEDFRALSSLNQNEYFDYESIMQDVTKITDARINEQAHKLEENVLNKINEKLENIDLNNTRELSKVLVEEIDNLNTVNTDLNNELNRLSLKDEKKSFINFNKSKENELKERLTNNISFNQAKESALNKTFIFLKDANKKSDLENIKLKEENDFLKTKIKSYDVYLKFLDKMEILNKELKELKKDNKNLIKENQENEEYINTLNQTLFKYELDRDNLKSKNQDLEIKNDFLKSENQELKTELNFYKKAYEKIKDFFIKIKMTSKLFDFLINKSIKENKFFYDVYNEQLKRAKEEKEKEKEKQQIEKDDQEQELKKSRGRDR